MAASDFERRHVAGGRHDDVGLAAGVVAGPFPQADSRRAVLDRLVHREPLRRRMLAGHDDVDVVPAAEAVVASPRAGSSSRAAGRPG